MKFKADYRKVSEGCIACVEELPSANSQGATLDEVRENLIEAARLIFATNRELAGR